MRFPTKFVCVFVMVTTLFYGDVSGQNTAAECSVASGSGSSEISGQISLSQPSSRENVTLTINLSGFAPNTVHGFHVHAEGSIGNKCLDAKGHLNVDDTLHGAPYDNQANRHTGDLGNVVADANGNIVDLILSDRLISLNGDYSIIDKPIVIHEGEDDLGRGGHPDSNTTGNAGGRMGCCLIQLSSSSSGFICVTPLASLFASLISVILGARVWMTSFY